MPAITLRRPPRPLLTALTALVVLLMIAVVVDLRTDRPQRGTTGAQEAPGFVTRERPNIILVSSDDQRLDEMQFLPEVERLIGEEGVTFDNAITPHPLCCPARAELMTGQLAQNNGVRGNFPPQGGYEAFDESQHIGVWLQEAGYNTAFLGKMLNGYSKHEGRDPGWDIFNATSHGYADYYDFKQFNEDDVEGVDGYYTDYVGEKAVEYVDELSQDDAPFFMWVSHFAPHPARQRTTCKKSTCGLEPPRSSPRYRAEERRTGETPQQDAADELARSIIESPAFNEEDMSDKQSLVRRQPKIAEDRIVRNVRARASALASLDDSIGPLVEELRAQGELDNTYLVFITDNGFQLGEHRWFGKILPYEENVRTPMLVRGPGIEPGSRTTATATIVDLVPTFLDIAGAKPSLRVDGTSLLDLWQGRQTEELYPGGVLMQGGPYKPETGKTGWLYRGLRTDRYTYARFHDGFVELYDRDRDPAQVDSVAGRGRYAEVEAELARRTRVLSGCQGAEECHQDFGPLPEPAR